MTNLVLIRATTTNQVKIVDNESHYVISESVSYFTTSLYFDISNGIGKRLPIRLTLENFFLPHCDIITDWLDGWDLFNNCADKSNKIFIRVKVCVKISAVKICSASASEQQN